ncbi:Retrovirus-related Pol polyprotein from type-1 retrotransposable element [Trichinella spiralis]|uniref:Retrovirus-related Pol polyprotein from type-1 retrotransposable element n=1 Tax=Trichinella spiralis TaxID=6334 RepID=A0A0V1AQY6_TRISP|nr:Retrovirus-related Pol polyprotein from type-1 retrotransposable element [Trichinella spiralis]
MMNSVDQTSQAIASMPQHQKSLHAALQHFSVPTATKDALKKGKRQPLRAEIAELTETYQGSCLPTFRKRSVEMQGEELPKTQRCCCADTAGIQPGHNKIVHLAAEHARREGFTVHVEHALKSEGQVYKPDLILIKGNAAHVLDVAVPWETSLWAVLLCRHCGHSTGQRETASHISQKCPHTKRLFIQLHNKIVHFVGVHARKEEFTVHLDQALKSGGQVYKPDLILIKGNTAHILDVAIPWQMGTDMHEHYERKRLCDNESDLVAIRDAINAVDEGKEAFINSRRARQEELPDSEKAKALADYDQLLGLVTRLQSKANDLLKNSSQQPDLSQNTATLHQGECVPLSAIVQIRKLLTYNGNILEFNAFWGQFDGAVHHRKDFDNVTKFVHLKSCLSGEALQLANGLTVMAENYEELVKLLHDRFHRTTDILDAHINRLHELQPASNHSRKELLRYAHLEETLTHVTQAYIWLSDAVAQASQLAAATDSNEAFLSFLSQQALCMDHTDNLANRKTRSPSARQNIRRQTRKHTTIDALHSSITPKCPVCRGDHRLPNCKRFLSQWLEERKKTARTLHLCFKCLQHGHQATECKLKGRDADNEKQPTQKKSRLEEKTEASANVLLTSTHGSTRIHFQTIRAIAHGAEGKRMTLQLSPLKSHPQEGVNQPIEALMLTNICDDISSVPYRNKNWKHLGQLHLPEERDMNLPIHILIGLDFCGRLLGEKILRGGHDDPVAIETTLGWVVFGPVNPSPNTISQVNCVQIENEIERTLKKFWELDSIGIKPQEENPTQDLVSAKFHSDLTHDGSRYTVGLLWKPGGIRLPNNRSLAEQRLQAMERVEDCDACRFLWRNCVQDSVNVIKAHAERNPEECDDTIEPYIQLTRGTTL